MCECQHAMYFCIHVHVWVALVTSEFGMELVVQIWGRRVELYKIFYGTASLSGNEFLQHSLFTAVSLWPAYTCKLFVNSGKIDGFLKEKF